jgi:hypothetical protein
MLRGKIITLNKWEAFFDANATFTTIGTGDLKNWGAQIYNYYSDSYISTAVGFQMTMSGVEITPALNATLDIPDLGISEVRAYAYADNGDSRLLFEDITIYTDTTGTWKLEIGAVTWTVNGAVELYDNTGWTLTGGLAVVQPTLNIFGTPPGMTGSIQNSVIPPTIGCNTSSFGTGWTADGYIIVEGGYRFDETGTWENLPVAWNHADQTPDAYVQGTTTDAIELRSAFSTSATGYDSEVITWQSDAFMIVPQMTKKLTRVQTDYEELVYRSGFQGVRRWDFSFTGEELDCTSEPIDPGTTSSVYTNTYPSKTELLANVRDTTHALEDVFGVTTYSPAGVSYQRSWAAQTMYGSDGANSRFGVDQYDTANLPPYHSFGGAQAWRSNFMAWTSPGWLMCPWFPPNTASSSIRWDLLGADSDIDYWFKIRQQYGYHPSLPSGENTLHRINIESDLINQNALNGVTVAAFDLPCWWGVSRTNILKQSDWLASVTTNASTSSRWSFWDGTSAGVGSVTATDVTLTTGDAIEFAMASYTVYPFMYPTVSDRIAINWTDPNVSTVNCYAVGFDGEKVLIGSTVATHRIPAGRASKWATSGGQDFGASYLTDEYQRVKNPSSKDISATVASDVNIITNYALLPGFACSKIRFEITRVNPANPVSIKHPTFYLAPIENAKVFYETGRISTLLFADGNAIRYGTLSFFNYTTKAAISTPLPADILYAPTIGDCWAFENCFFRARDALTDLSTRLAAEFVLNEEYTIVKHLWTNPDDEITSISGVWYGDNSPVFWYGNTYRSIPPMNLFPEKERTKAADWLPTGTRMSQMVSYATGKHPFIVPLTTTAPELKLGAGANLLTPVTSVTGWRVSSWSPTPNNNEGYDYSLWWSGVEWIKVRPWRGFFNVLDFLSHGCRLSADIDFASNVHVRAFADNAGNVLIYKADNTLAFSLVNTLALNATSASIRIDRQSNDQKLYLVVEDEPDIKLYVGDSAEGTFTLMRTIATGKKPIIVIGRDGNRYIYWLDGTSIKGEKTDRADTILATGFTVVASGVDDECMAVDEDVYDGGKRRLVLFDVESGSVVQRTSEDGETFV